MSKEKLQLIDDLVTGGETCVLATLDGNEPNTALMTFFADHAVMKFYFLMRTSSRKYKNLMSNPHVSILIDRREKYLALSIDGVHSPIRDKQTVEAITKLYLIKNPHMQEFAGHPETKLVRVEGRFASLAQGFTEVFTTKLKNS